MTAYTWLWFGWFLYFGVVEGWALYASWQERKTDPDHVGGTLSEHVWRWFSTMDSATGGWWAWVRRGALVVFLTWLTVHFLFGGRIV